MNQVHESKRQILQLQPELMAYEDQMDKVHSSNREDDLHKVAENTPLLQPACKSPAQQKLHQSVTNETVAAVSLCQSDDDTEVERFATFTHQEIYRNQICDSLDENQSVNSEEVNQFIDGFVTKNSPRQLVLTHDQHEIHKLLFPAVEEAVGRKKRFLRPRANFKCLATEADIARVCLEFSKYKIRYGRVDPLNPCHTAVQKFNITVW